MSHRLLAIGDIHGCAVAFESLLNLVEVDSSDVVVLLGDLIDKGPDSKRVIEIAMKLEQQCQLVLIEGNHERALRHHFEWFGRDQKAWAQRVEFVTRKSYADSIMPEAHVNWLASAVDYYESDTDIFAHAGLDPWLALSEQDPTIFCTYRPRLTDPPHISGKRIIHGHVLQLTGIPIHRNGWTNIDTAAFKGGWLTCLDVRSNQYFQANEEKQTRVRSL